MRRRLFTGLANLSAAVALLALGAALVAFVFIFQSALLSQPGESAMPNPRPAYVVADGPFPSKYSADGEERPQWTVIIYTAQDTPLREYHVGNFTRAVSLADEIARDRNLELVIDAAQD